MTQQRKCAECSRTKSRHLWLAKEWKKKGPAMCKACYKRGPGHRSERDRYLRTNYKISLDEYNVILTAQEGRCAVCRKKPRRRLLAVDHDHAIEKEQGIRGSVRGLLCRPCNEYIGHIGDSPTRAIFLRSYLETGHSETQRLIG